MRSAVVPLTRHSQWEISLKRFCTLIESFLPWPHVAVFDWAQYRTGCEFGLGPLDGLELTEPILGRRFERWPPYASSHSDDEADAMRFHCCFRVVGAHLMRVWSALEQRVERKVDFWRMMSEPEPARAFAQAIALSQSRKRVATDEQMQRAVDALARVLVPTALCRTPPRSRPDLVEIYAHSADALDVAAYLALSGRQRRLLQAFSRRRLAAVWCTQLAYRVFRWRAPFGGPRQPVAARDFTDRELAEHRERVYGSLWSTEADPIHQHEVVMAAMAVDEVHEAVRVALPQPMAEEELALFLYGTSFNVLHLVAAAAAERRLRDLHGPWSTHSEAHLVKWARDWSWFHSVPAS